MVVEFFWYQLASWLIWWVSYKFRGSFHFYWLVVGKKNFFMIGQRWKRIERKCKFIKIKYVFITTSFLRIFAIKEVKVLRIRSRIDFFSFIFFYWKINTLKSSPSYDFHLFTQTYVYFFCANNKITLKYNQLIFFFFFFNELKLESHSLIKRKF